MNPKRKKPETPARASRLSPPRISRAEGRRAKTDGQQITAILERINDGFIAFDAQMNYIYVNKRGGELLGREPENLIGKNYWEEFPEARGTPFANAYVRALETQEPIVFEDYFTPWDRWFENRIYPSRNGLTIFFTETTERKKDQLEIGQLKKFSEAVIQSANDAISVVDINGIFKMINRAGTEIFGRHVGEIVGHHWNEIIPPDQHAIVESAMRERRQGKSNRYKLELARPNGERRNVLVSGSPLFDSGKMTGAMAVFTDITEHKRAEEALRESEERYRQLLEVMPIGVAVHAEGKIVFTNPSGAKLLGANSPDELAGRPIHDIVHPDGWEQARDRIGRMLAGEKDLYPTEDRYLRLDGTTIDVEVSAAPLMFQGKPAVQVVVSDITERKRAEQLLKTELQVLEKISSGSSLPEILETIVLAIEALSRETIASILLLDPDGIHVRYGAAPHLPDNYNRAIEGAPIGPQEGSCGTAMFLRKPIVVTDIESDPLWNNYRELARQHGLRACWSTPVMSRDGAVLASFAMYYRESRSPQRGDFILIERATHMAQIAIERKLAEEKLRLSEQKFSDAFYTSPAGMTITRIADGRFIDANESFLRTFEFTREEAIGATSIALNLWTVEEREKIIQRQLETGGLKDFELQARTKSGRIKNILFSSRPMELEGEPHHITTMIDITDRKRAEEQVKQQLQRLAALRTIDITISGSLDLRITLDTILKHVIAQLRVDAAAVLLLNPLTNMLEFASGHGFRERDIAKLSLRLGEDYAGRAALERRLVSIPNLKEAERPFSQIHLTKGEDFVSYYGAPLISKGKVKGVLEVFHRTALISSPEWLDFLETLAGQVAIAVDNAQLFEGLQRANAGLAQAYETTIEGWSRALDLRDKETEGHTQRVTEMTLRLARAAGIAEDELVHIRRGALLHDIGKMGVPDTILLKPDSLTDEEWIAMRKHPTYAYELLSPIAYLRQALDIPYCHHEKWDSTGYPRGLKGEEIPLAARLFAVADVWDALTNERPYRKAWPEDRAIQYILEQAGQHFDPKVVELFLQIRH